MSRICVFGDSIARGAVDPVHGGWVALLRNYFESKDFGVGADTQVYNLGISGDNTDDLIKRFDVEREAREPDSIIIAIGVNDSQFVLSKKDNRVSLNKFKSNISSILEKVKDLKEVYVVGITRVDEARTAPIPWNLDKEYRNEYIEKYDNVLKELSDDFGVTYIDMSSALDNNLLDDGLHPNSAGHQKMFEVVKESLKV